VGVVVAGACGASRQGGGEVGPWDGGRGGARMVARPACHSTEAESAWAVRENKPSDGPGLRGHSYLYRAAWHRVR